MNLLIFLLIISGETMGSFVKQYWYACQEVEEEVSEAILAYVIFGNLSYPLFIVGVVPG